MSARIFWIGTLLSSRLTSANFSIYRSNTKPFEKIFGQILNKFKPMISPKYTYIHTGIVNSIGKSCKTQYV
ncbi:hypothetical protein ACB092_06G039200 [Castanea dentata]